MPNVLFRSMVVVCLWWLTASSFAFVPESDDDETPAATTTVETTGPSGYNPPIQPASDEGERALSSFRVPEGMQASLVAAEPLLANPVAFWIDEQGRYWVCETFRQGNAVTDNRDRGYWLFDDLAAQTVEDRYAYHKKHLGEEGLKAFTEHHDRIRLLTDADGDGKLDKATVFADGFNSVVEGTGAGVMTVGDDVYYTNIPNLWKLRDTNGDGVADERDAMFTGFGVRVAFRGHDLHGLVVGPDGRIYFSIGDRGFNVVNKEGKRLVMPDTGAVFRCEPDGSNLEIYAYGFRNPQELAFDVYGNLFTGDNNSDSGDKARWVYVAEGSDSGWRMHYQYERDRGPWNRELMWLPYDTPAQDREIASGAPIGVAAKDVQPAYILPPVANLADGPSGLTHYPGVGLDKRYDGHFFLCDFRGTPNNSGVRSFAVKPKGAGFEVVDSHEFVWSILATDADFAPDGRFVISDWVNGWNGEGKGRLYSFSDPKHADVGKESAKLLAEDFSQRTPEKLLGFFEHPDRRVRQKAQFALAKHRFTNWPEQTVETLRKSGSNLAQLHLTWAIGQRLRIGDTQGSIELVELMQSVHPAVRAQAVKMIGDGIPDQNRRGPVDENDFFYPLVYAVSVMPAVACLSDDDARVRREAVILLGKIGRDDVEKLSLDDLSEHSAERILAAGKSLEHPVETLLDLLGAVGDSDPVLRNSAHVALATLEDADGLLAATEHPSPYARTGAVVALRRLHSDKVAAFLNDADPSVVTEAARAINDVPIDAATPQLAAFAGRDDLNDPTLRRVLNANFRLGGKENAAAVAKIAASDATPIEVRIEAIEELKLWAEPPRTDRVTGMFRPIEPRDASFVADVVEPLIGNLLSASDGDVRKAAIELAAAYQIEAGPALLAMVEDAGRPAGERIAALNALAATGTNDLNAILDKAITDESAALRSAARSLWAKDDPLLALPVLDITIAEGEVVEKQGAIADLVEIGNDAADNVLAKWFDKFVSGQVPAEIGLDLLEAAGQRDALKGRLDAYQSGVSSDDPLAAWRVSLVGGNAEQGRDIFLNRASVSCLRCHKVEGDRGGEVGPNLSKIGAEKDREYLLASIVTPNAKIAEGFESIVIVNSDGQVLTGVKRAEDDESVTIITAEAKTIVIPKNEIEDRAVGLSAMPEDLLKHLSKRDVRDLVEYLATQQGE